MKIIKFLSISFSYRWNSPSLSATKWPIEFIANILYVKKKNVFQWISTRWRKFSEKSKNLEIGAFLPNKWTWISDLNTLRSSTLSLSTWSFQWLFILNKQNWFQFWLNTLKNRISNWISVYFIKLANIQLFP